MDILKRPLTLKQCIDFDFIIKSDFHRHFACQTNCYHCSQNHTVNNVIYMRNILDNIQFMCINLILEAEAYDGGRRVEETLLEM